MSEWRQTKVSSDFHEGFRIPGVSSKRTVCRIFWDSSMTESTEWNKDSTNVKLIVKTNDCWCVNFPWDCLTSREHVRLRSSSCSVNSPYRHEPHPFLYCRMSQSQRTHPPEIKTQYINGFVKLPRKLGMWISWISSSYFPNKAFKMRGGSVPWGLGGLVWFPFSDAGKSSPQYSIILNMSFIRHTVAVMRMWIHY